MSPLSSIRCQAVALLALLLVLPAHASGDLEPPNYRYSEQSTVTGWDFVTDQPAERVLPDLHSLASIFGKAPLPIQPLAPGATHTPHGRIFGKLKWIPDLGGGYLPVPPSNPDERLLPDDNGMTFLVPMWANGLESQVLLHELRIQVTHLGDAPHVEVIAMPGLPGAVKSAAHRDHIRSDVPLAGGISYFYEDWSTTPGSWQMVTLSLGPETQLLSVVIDTGNVTVDELWQHQFESGD